MNFMTTEHLNYLNVNGSDDPHYRYKMPPIITFCIAKNGGTTIISNTKEIASAIYREPSDLASCFSKALGTKVNRNEDNNLIITGKHACIDLQCILFKYIKQYVLCEKCGSPETVPYRKIRKCQACGAFK
jgi:translation initiation factor 5